MVTTIAPVVHGRRRSRYLLSLGLHALGATAAAAALGAALGGVGALARAAGTVLGANLGPGAPGAGAALLAGVALLYAARELLRVPVPVPQRHAQVPDWWRTFYPAPIAALLYGVGLGLGFLTYLRHGTLVAIAAAALVVADPVAGAALWAPFGAARGLSVAVGAIGPGPETAVERLESLATSPLPRLVNGGALVAVAVAALA